jgi:hypothetical protein
VAAVGGVDACVFKGEEGSEFTMSSYCDQLIVVWANPEALAAVHLQDAGWQPYIEFGDHFSRKKFIWDLREILTYRI